MFQPLIILNSCDISRTSSAKQVSARAFSVFQCTRLRIRFGALGTRRLRHTLVNPATEAIEKLLGDPLVFVVLPDGVVHDMPFVGIVPLSRLLRSEMCFEMVASIVGSSDLHSFALARRERTWILSHVAVFAFVPFQMFAPVEFRTAGLPVLDEFALILLVTVCHLEFDRLSDAALLALTLNLAAVKLVTTERCAAGCLAGPL